MKYAFFNKIPLDSDKNFGRNLPKNGLAVNIFVQIYTFLPTFGQNQYDLGLYYHSNPLTSANKSSAVS